MNGNKHKFSLSFRLVTWLVMIVFTQSTVLPAAYAQMFMPQPGVMINLSSAYTPVIMRGVKVDRTNPFKFEFIVDQGDGDEAFEAESEKIIKYFLASLTTPEDDLWVNLSPYEEDRIIPDSFGLTEMGRDLLAQDYLLKQITATLMYPEDETGEAFWEKVYARAYEEFGTTEIPVNTFNKVWIVPEKARVYENDGTAFVIEQKLKVMLEEDYLAKENHVIENRHPERSEGSYGDSSPAAQNDSTLASEVVREIIIPELEYEVNEGKNFAQLRQVYHSLILATWYKEKLRDSIVNKIYSDRNKVKGIDVDDPEIKNKIYEQYLEAFKVGVYNYIREDYDENLDEFIPRQYFAGGFNLNLATDHSAFGELRSSVLDITTDAASLAQANYNEGDLRIVEANAVPQGEGIEPTPIIEDGKPTPWQLDRRKFLGSTLSLLGIGAAAACTGGCARLSPFIIQRGVDRKYIKYDYVSELSTEWLSTPEKGTLQEISDIIDDAIEQQTPIADVRERIDEIVNSTMIFEESFTASSRNGLAKNGAENIVKNDLAFRHLIWQLSRYASEVLLNDFGVYDKATRRLVRDYFRKNTIVGYKKGINMGEAYTLGIQTSFFINLGLVESVEEILAVALHEYIHLMDKRRTSEFIKLGLPMNSDTVWLGASAIDEAYSKLMYLSAQWDYRKRRSEPNLSIQQFNTPQETHIDISSLADKASVNTPWSKILEFAFNRRKPGLDISEVPETYEDGKKLGIYAERNYGQDGIFLIKMYMMHQQEMNFAQMELAAAILANIRQDYEILTKDITQLEEVIRAAVLEESIPFNITYDDLLPIENRMTDQLSQQLSNQQLIKIDSAIQGSYRGGQVSLGDSTSMDAFLAQRKIIPDQIQPEEKSMDDLVVEELLQFDSTDVDLPAEPTVSNWRELQDELVTSVAVMSHGGGLDITSVFTEVNTAMTEIKGKLKRNENDTTLDFQVRNDEYFDIVDQFDVGNQIDWLELTNKFYKIQTSVEDIEKLENESIKLELIEQVKGVYIEWLAEFREQIVKLYSLYSNDDFQDLIIMDDDLESFVQDALYAIEPFYKFNIPAIDVILNDSVESNMLVKPIQEIINDETEWYLKTGKKFDKFKKRLRPKVIGDEFNVRVHPGLLHASVERILENAQEYLQELDWDGIEPLTIERKDNGDTFDIIIRNPGELSEDNLRNLFHLKPISERRAFNEGGVGSALTGIATRKMGGTVKAENVTIDGMPMVQITITLPKDSAQLSKTEILDDFLSRYENTKWDPELFGDSEILSKERVNERGQFINFKRDYSIQWRDVRDYYRSAVSKFAELRNHVENGNAFTDKHLQFIRAIEVHWRLTARRGDLDEHRTRIFPTIDTGARLLSKMQAKDLDELLLNAELVLLKMFQTNLNIINHKLYSVYTEGLEIDENELQEIVSRIDELESPYKPPPTMLSTLDSSSVKERFLNVLKQATNGDYESLRNRILEIGMRKNIMAHGVEASKSSFAGLVNIALEGQIRPNASGDFFIGLLSHGNAELVAGPHGPYYATFVDERGGVDKQEYFAEFIVRNETEKQVALELIQLAVDQSKITPGLGQQIKEKFYTYEEWIAKHDPAMSASADSKKFKKWMKNRVSRFPAIMPDAHVLTESSKAFKHLAPELRSAMHSLLSDISDELFANKDLAAVMGELSTIQKDLAKTFHINLDRIVRQGDAVYIPFRFGAAMRVAKPGFTNDEKVNLVKSDRVRDYKIGYISFIDFLKRFREVSPDTSIVIDITAGEGKRTSQFRDKFYDGQDALVIASDINTPELKEGFGEFQDITFVHQDYNDLVNSNIVGIFDHVVVMFPYPVSDEYDFKRPGGMRDTLLGINRITTPRGIVEVVTENSSDYRRYLTQFGYELNGYFDGTPKYAWKKDSSALAVEGSDLNLDSAMSAEDKIQFERLIDRADLTVLQAEQEEETIDRYSVIVHAIQYYLDALEYDPFNLDVIRSVSLLRAEMEQYEGASELIREKISQLDMTRHSLKSQLQILLINISLVKQARNFSYVNNEIRTIEKRWRERQLQKILFEVGVEYESNGQVYIVEEVFYNIDKENQVNQYAYAQVQETGQKVVLTHIRDEAEVSKLEYLHEKFELNRAPNVISFQQDQNGNMVLITEYLPQTFDHYVESRITTEINLGINDAVNNAIALGNDLVDINTHEPNDEINDKGGLPLNHSGVKNQNVHLDEDGNWHLVDWGGEDKINDAQGLASLLYAAVTGRVIHHGPDLLYEGPNNIWLYIDANNLPREVEERPNEVNPAVPEELSDLIYLGLKGEYKIGLFVHLLELYQAGVDSALQSGEKFNFAEFSLEYPNVASRFNQATIKALAADPFLKPVFLYSLPEEAHGEFEFIDHVVLEKLWGSLETAEEQLSEFAPFKVRSAQIAENFIKNGGQEELITVGLVSNIKHGNLSSPHGRMVFLIQEDGTYFAYKGIGQNLSDEQGAFFYSDDNGKFMGLMDEWEHILAKSTYNRLDYNGAIVGQYLGSMRYDQLINDEFELIDVKDINDENETQVSPNVSIYRVANPHRLSELRQILAKDEGLVQITAQLNHSLKALDRIDQDKELSPNEMLHHMWSEFGKTEGVKTNLEIIKNTLHYQDLYFSGDEADLEEAVEASEDDLLDKKYKDLRVKIGILLKIIKIIRDDEHRRGKKVGLLPNEDSAFQLFKTFMKSYFASLSKKELRYWIQDVETDSFYPIEEMLEKNFSGFFHGNVQSNDRVVEFIQEWAYEADAALQVDQGVDNALILEEKNLDINVGLNKLNIPSSINYHNHELVLTELGDGSLFYVNQERRQLIQVFNDIEQLTDEHLEEYVRLNNELHRQRPDEFVEIKGVVKVNSKSQIFIRHGLLMEYVPGVSLQDILDVNPYNGDNMQMQQRINESLDWIDKQTNGLAYRSREYLPHYSDEDQDVGFDRGDYKYDHVVREFVEERGKFRSIPVNLTPIDMNKLVNGIDSVMKANVAPEIIYDGVKYNKFQEGTQGTIYVDWIERNLIKVFNKVDAVEERHLQRLVELTNQLHEKEPDLIIKMHGVVGFDTGVEGFPKHGIKMKYFDLPNIVDYVANHYSPALEENSNRVAGEITDWIDKETNGLADRQTDSLGHVGFGNFIVDDSNPAIQLINFDPIDMIKLKKQMDSSLVTDPTGGIDFRPEGFRIEIEGQGNVKFEFDLQELETMQIDGFTPVIINIRPMTNLPLFLGIKEDEESETRLSQVTY